MRYAVFFIVLLFAGRKAAAGTTEELVIRTTPLSEWAVSKIGRQLLCLEGVHFSGYDVRSSCLLIRCDVQRLESTGFVLEILRVLNKPLRFSEVCGYTFYEVVDGKLSAEGNEINK